MEHHPSVGIHGFAVFAVEKNVLNDADDDGGNGDVNTPDVGLVSAGGQSIGDKTPNEQKQAPGKDDERDSSNRVTLLYAFSLVVLPGWRGLLGLLANLSVIFAPPIYSFSK